MAISFRFREKLLGGWETARGFLVAEFDYLYSGLTPLSPLSDSLATLQFTQTGKYPATSVLTTDSAGVSAFTTWLPAPLQFPPALTITPPPMAGAENDYSPAGFDQAAQVRLSTQLPGGTNLTGMKASLLTGGVYRLLVNVGTNSGAISLPHNNAGSALGNRFSCANLATYILTSNSAVLVWYDPIARYWQVIGR